MKQLSDEELAWLIRELDALSAAEGGDATELPAPPTLSTAGVQADAQGREPVAHACGCGLCERYRQSSG